MRSIRLLVIVALALVGCDGQATPTTVTVAVPTSTLPTSSSAAPVSLRLLTHDSFLISESIQAALEQATGIKLEVLKGGDAGLMVTQALLTKDNPIADVMYGIDNTNLTRALEAGLFESYTAAGLADVADGLQLDPQHRVTPIDFGDVCLNYDKAAFAASGLAVPDSLEALTLPEYKDLLVVEDPATSSPGMAFLLATIAHFGEDQWEDYWRKLAANGVEVATDWTTAYYGRFSGASPGDRPLVVSYASSPPAQVHLAAEPLAEAPTGVITDGCFRQIEFAGILTGTSKPEAAQRLVEFMLSPQFQEDIPLQMFVFPANAKAKLPEVFERHAVIPEQPLGLDPGLIQTNRASWLERWNRAVLG